MSRRFPSRCFPHAFQEEQLGQNMLEFAITFLIVMMLVFIMIEGFSMVHAYTVLADAANEGLRYFIVNSGNPTGAQTVATNYAANTLHDISTLNATCTNIDPVLPLGGRVSCTISYVYVPYLTNFLSNPPHMHAYAEGRTVN